MIYAGYMLPMVVLILCLIVAAVLISSPLPEDDEADVDSNLQDDGQDTNHWLKDQRRLLKLLSGR